MEAGEITKPVAPGGWTRASPAATRGLIKARLGAVVEMGHEVALDTQSKDWDFNIPEWMVVQAIVASFGIILMVFNYDPTLWIAVTIATFAFVSSILSIARLAHLSRKKKLDFSDIAEAIIVNLYFAICLGNFLQIKKVYGFENFINLSLVPFALSWLIAIWQFDRKAAAAKHFLLCNGKLIPLEVVEWGLTKVVLRIAKGWDEEGLQIPPPPSP